MPESSLQGVGLALVVSLALVVLTSGSQAVGVESGPALEVPASIDSDGLDAVRHALAEEQKKLATLTSEIESAEQRLGELQTELTNSPSAGASESQAIARDVKSALDKANILEQTAVAARQRIAGLSKSVEAGGNPETAANSQTTWLVDNPFTPQRLLQWGLDHGPRLVTILVAALLLYLLVKLSGRHLARLVAHGGSRGTLHERENRAITLVGVFQNVATIAVLAGGTLMLLEEIGIPILPLMGGAAVLGLAVAFGSQNLIKDYFSGFMLLMEDQYGVNDVVKIGEISGAVEQITLRVTVLRDLEGVVHFIPHGTITTVSNMTHGWSRALLDIAVGYKEDTDRVMATMLEVAKELRGDEQFGPQILDDAEMLGVDLLGDSSISVKMVIKTHPLKRWAVRREYLRRIKQRFDQLGIEIPFPYRNVLVRQIDGAKQTDAA